MNSNNSPNSPEPDAESGGNFLNQIVAFDKSKLRKADTTVHRESHTITELHDFTGLEDTTDIQIHKYSVSLTNDKSHARNKKAPAKFTGLKLNGCKYLTIWALHYFGQTFNLTLTELCKRLNVMFERNFKCTSFRLYICCIHDCIFCKRKTQKSCAMSYLVVIGLAKP